MLNVFVRTYLLELWSMQRNNIELKHKLKQQLQSKNMNSKQIRNELNKVKAPHNVKLQREPSYINCNSDSPRCHLDGLNHKVGDRNRCEIWKSIKNMLRYSIKLKNLHINPCISIWKLSDYMLTDKNKKKNNDNIPIPPTSNTTNLMVTNPNDSQPQTIHLLKLMQTNLSSPSSSLTTIK